MSSTISRGPSATDHPHKGPDGVRRRRTTSTRRLTLGALAVAVLAMFTTAAFARTSISLGVGKRTVSGKPQTIVVDGRGVTVYALGGESLAHLECVTRACFNVWQPLKVSSATAKVVKAPGVPGTVDIIRRVRGGFSQVTLDRHPLYDFSGDKGRRGSTTGQGIKRYGGSWHVLAAS
jgi:predicted lipoprotein with Yx(FWY)xxD motif